MVVCVRSNALTVGFPLESFPQHLTTSSSLFFCDINFIPIGLQPANGSAAATAKVVGTVGVTGRKQEVRKVLRKAFLLVTFTRAAKTEMPLSFSRGFAFGASPPARAGSDTCAHTHTQTTVVAALLFDMGWL